MADDLEELRRRRRAEFRRKEEERRQMRLREAQSRSDAVAISRTAVAMAPPKPPPSSRPASMLQKRPTLGESKKDNPSPDIGDTPKQTYFRSSCVPKAIAPYSKASPSSSVSFSQSPGVKRKRKTGYLDSDSSDDDDEAFIAAARRLEQRAKQKESDRKSSSTTNLSTNPQPPSSRPKALAASLFQDSDSDGDDDKAIVKTSRKLEAKRPERESSESKPEVPPSAESNGTQRNPLALMREDAKKTYSSPPEAVDVPVNLWSDSEDEKPADLPDREKKKKKNRVQMKERKQDYNRNFNSAELPSVSDEVAEREKLMPEFENPKFGPFPLEPLHLKRSPDAETFDFAVPASINRYLPDYQRVGVQFVYESIMARKGAILGDDMGLGKTVETVALISALLEKKGTGEDLVELHRRRKTVDAWAAQMEISKREALRNGQILTVSNTEIAKDLHLPRWAPVLILVPPTIVPNWINDFNSWGHFGTELYENGRERALDRIKQGYSEILICRKSAFMRRADFKEISTVRWKMVVVDEMHLFKKMDGIATVHLRTLRDHCDCSVVGLTGTLMQNNHEELWTLVDLVAKNYLGPWETFKEDFEKPIKLSRTKDANAYAIELGELRSREFSARLNKLFIQRTKEEELSDKLPMKDERIVFCELSELQKKIYQHLLTLPDFLLLINAPAPCDCGVNQKYFLEYQHLTSREEKIEYQRRNVKHLVNRAKCCGKRPVLSRGSDELHPHAVLWRQHKDHTGGDECEKCPYCILFSALHVCYKVSSHAALLQMETTPDQYGEGSNQRSKALDDLERAEVFLPPEIRDQLPGGLYRKASIMNDHFKMSGKLKVLDRLLRAIDRQNGRVLLFSASTQALDLIQNYIRSEGFSHLRMDGSTSGQRRKEIAEEFRRDPNVFIFLLSTKAMGLGLNLTEANYVIIFDVEWNPSYDAQAQDRAYRIGQRKDVKVFRLVSRGTIEELKYLRQVYKTQLKSETIIDVNDEERDTAARLFRGVAGDVSRKGELFGLGNLLKYKDGTFMNYSTQCSDNGRYGEDVHRIENLLETVQDMTEEEFDTLGDQDNFFEDLARRTVKDNPGSEDDIDDDCEMTLGGESQAILDYCDRVKVPEEVSKDNAVVASQLPTVLEGGDEDVLSQAKPWRRTNDDSPVQKTEATSSVLDGQKTESASPIDLRTPTFKQTDRCATAEIPVPPAPKPATLKEKDKKASSPIDLRTPGSESAVPLAPEPATLKEKDKKACSPIDLRTPGAENGFAANSEMLLPLALKPHTPDDKIAASPAKLNGDNAGSPQSVSSTGKKSSVLNTKLVGTTTNQIKEGVSAKTTFSALDLALPSGGTKKKRKKKKL